MSRKEMNEKDKKTSEKKFIVETRIALSSENENEVLTKLHQLKSDGKVSILPCILDLFQQSGSEIVKQEVIHFISDLNDQECASVIIEYINNDKLGDYLGDVIASCWQSGLDYSRYLKTFAKCFVIGDYKIALESFTVIEEMLWKTPANSIGDCRSFILGFISEISDEKKPLFDALLKVLDEGRSHNADDFPDIYYN